jgi:hypothetical protein
MSKWSLLAFLPVAAVAAVGCGGAPRTQYVTVIVPESFVRPPNTTAQLAPVARGTIRLGAVDTPSSLAPTATGGGPPAEGTAGTPSAAPPGPPMAQTSVGPMSPTTVTGADSPFDSSPTAPPAGGGPGNPLTIGSTVYGGMPPR